MRYSRDLSFSQGVLSSDQSGLTPRRGRGQEWEPKATEACRAGAPRARPSFSSPLRPACMELSSRAKGGRSQLMGGGRGAGRSPGFLSSDPSTVWRPACRQPKQPLPLSGPTEGLDRAVSVRLAQCSLGSRGRPGAAQRKHRTPLAVFQFHPIVHPQHFLQGCTSSLLLPQAFRFTEAPGRWAVFVAFVLRGPMSLEVLRPQGPSQARTEGSPCPLTPRELQQGPPRPTPSRVPWASARPWPPQGGPAGENKAAPLEV